MYVIFRTGGSQYLASEGDKIIVPLLKAEPGTDVKFDDVLLLKTESDLLIGTPRVANGVVEAKVVEHMRNDKVVIAKFARREKSERRMKTHRQKMTLIQISRIGQTTP